MVLLPTEKPKNKLLPFILVALVIIILIIGGIWVATKREANNKNQQINLLSNYTYSAGDTATINMNDDVNDKSGGVIVSIDEASFNELIGYVIVNDLGGLGRLVAAKKVFDANNGTRVRVLEVYYSKIKVRILEGEHEGKEGWVPYEYVK